MEDIVLEEIVKNCNWYEKIIIKILKKQFIKVYNTARKNTVNALLK